MSDLLDTLWSAPTAFRSDLFAGQVALVCGGGSGIDLFVVVLVVLFL